MARQTTQSMRLRITFAIFICIAIIRTSNSFTSIQRSRVSTTHTALFVASSRPKGKPGNKGKKSKSNSKWGNRKGKKKYNPKPRPVLTDYYANTDPREIEGRLLGAINCEHFGSCAGCVTNEHVGEVDVIQSAKRYFSSTAVRKNRMDVYENGEDWVVEDDDDGFYEVVVPTGITGWRTHAKLVVTERSSSWANDGCIFGLYKRGTHDVLEIPKCAVHHPSINLAVQELEKATAKVGTAAFSKESREGGLRYVQLQVERTTGKVSLTLVWAASELKYAQPALSRLTKQLSKSNPDLWHSMWCHCNESPGNNIFTRNSRNWYQLSGNEFVREPISVGEYGWLYFTPLTFRQGNMDGFDILANDVARSIPGGSKVCELYAGVGLLGLTSLVHHSQEPNEPLVWVRCSDENPANLRSFTRSLSSIPVSISEYDRNGDGDKKDLTLGEIMKMMEEGKQLEDDRSGQKASYVVASAGVALKSGQALGADVLVVDPPRKGLEEEVLQQLCKPVNPNQPQVESPKLLTMPDEVVNWTNDVQTLVYVSCGFDALVSDCDKLLSSQGGWALERATGYVLFPGSNHVETICIFHRQ
eukprot:CAMPEP_0113628418 /NCGR_PEP_ID=MMETSP0017_2-20120614/14724_1 /TAXON_ID=2856 /ORGANISM="Cylindrotheca closterium" /LENGTH=585 /DNA_ID=CAMNT_0000538721 /DNA_START=15 /DNA_END=1772 /DNA_ORIENTATION=- /assembly_acc=CAM_ASM_000147